MSRSQLYATALADFLSRRGSQQGKERLDAIYGGEESTLDSNLIKLQIKSLPPEEWWWSEARFRTVDAVLLTSNLRLIEAPGNVLIAAADSGSPDRGRRRPRPSIS